MNTLVTEPPGGPTLVEIRSAPTTPVYKSIHKGVSPGHPKYKHYIACKKRCKESYDEHQYQYEVSLVEIHDRYSVFLYTLDENNSVEATLRICRDSAQGLPIAMSLQETWSHLRRRELRLAEPGRFVIVPESSNYRRFVAAAYEIGLHWGIDAHLLQVRSEQIEFYQKVCGAELLPSVMAPTGCTNMLWYLPNTPRLFFRAFGSRREEFEKLVEECGELQ